MPFDLPRAADWSPFLQALAPVRDYTRRAWIAFILYGALFFPGLIASAYWWREARQEEVRSGIAPRGKGCLTALVLYGIAMVALGLMGFLVYVAM